MPRAATATSLVLLAAAACLPAPHSPVGLHCTVDSDCGPALFCVREACAETRPPGFCDTEKDCAATDRCIASSCVPSACGATPCRPGSGCISGRCVDSACAVVSCPGGTACANGTCVASSCGAVACGPQAVCVTDTCVSIACVGVVCSTGQLCADGVCEQVSCNGTPCAAGQVCSGGACADASCVGLQCPAGDLCVGGACVPSCGVTADLMTDPDNCGFCGRRCAEPAHARRSCRAGQCTRTACEMGTFDFDGAATFGCESTCTARTCMLGSGSVVTLGSEPLPEAGHEWASAATASSHGPLVQTSAMHTNFGVLGEPTPALEDGTVRSSSATHQNVGGFTRALR